MEYYTQFVGHILEFKFFGLDIVNNTFRIVQTAHHLGIANLT